MFSSDKRTFEALNSLTTSIQDQTRPLVIWVGAGASTWAGYPLWLDFAAKMHTIFSREELGYNKKFSSYLLTQEKYPELFEQMRIANQPRYFAYLSEQFGPKASNGVHLRLLKLLRKLSTPRIVTTNVDESLEHNLPELATVQQSDIELLPHLLNKQIPFICKLHGSVSSVETMVFSKKDYDSILLNETYLNAIRTMFSSSTVLFLGYGLRDEYVIQSLIENSTKHPLFGTGPHFIVTSQESIDLPDAVRCIRYVPEITDHRDALQVLETVVEFTPTQPVLVNHENDKSLPASESIYFIADLFPVGKWETSQTIQFKSTAENKHHHMIVGDGYIDGEVDLHDYSALHDIVVGLLCFDIVYVSIDNLARLHDLLGYEAFWNFVNSGALRIVIPPAEPAIIFPDAQSITGTLMSIHLGSKDSEEGAFKSLTISERIRRAILPVPGKEIEAEKLFHLLEATSLDLTEVLPSNSLDIKMHSALMHPSIRRLLGISFGTPRYTIPRWLFFPVLRLARVVRCGVICQAIKASSTRMLWGSEKLASVAFSASSGTEWADTAASYVLTGQFNSDIGSIIEKDPKLLLDIMKFRESLAGSTFRQEIAQRLAADDGGQIVTAINAGLHQALPASVLQQARNQMSGLFIPSNPASVIIPAVWGDLRNSDKRISGWRKRSRTILESELKRLKLGPYDDCPCGSGEKLKFCCQAALI